MGLLTAMCTYEAPAGYPAVAEQERTTLGGGGQRRGSQLLITGETEALFHRTSQILFLGRLGPSLSFSVLALNTGLWKRKYLRSFRIFSLAPL